MTGAARPAAVVFDLDGTLIDSLPAIRVAFDAVCDELSLPRPDRATAQGFVGGGVPLAMTRLLRWAGADGADPDLHGRAIAAMHAAYGRVPPRANAVYPGVRETLDRLTAHGIPLGLCTNKPAAPTRTVLAALDLDVFAAVVAGDTLATRKPDPAPLHHVLAALGAMPADAVYVGDSEIDHATAAAAGVPFAFFEGGYLNAPLGAPAPALRLSHMGDLPDRLSAVA